MEPFENILGNEDAKKYFIKAVNDKQLSHSYIFEGPYGVGKNTFALELAKFVLCENKEGDRPCNKCQSCHMINAGTHPDVIQIEKDTKVTKIENIRENIIKEIDIKPYRSAHKFIIVKSADSINVQGQNAILKTIEEPPSYAVIILACENIASLLPTIKSRCIVVRFNPLSTEQMEDYLKQQGVVGTEQEVYARLAEGCIGVMQDILEDENYLALRKESVNYLQRLDRGQVMEIYDLVKEITDQKENIEQILNFWLLWYRDVMVIKVAKSEDLYYKDYQQQLLDMSYKLTYNKLSQNLGFIKSAILDIRQNIYSTFVIENLLLKLKESKK